MCFSACDGTIHGTKCWEVYMTLQEKLLKKPSSHGRLCDQTIAEYYRKNDPTFSRL